MVWRGWDRADTIKGIMGWGLRADVGLCLVSQLYISPIL